MTNFYSQPHPEAAPPLTLLTSPGLSSATATVVLAYRPDCSPALLEEALNAARREDAALRIVMYSTDMTAGPSGGRLRDAKALAQTLIAAELEYEIQRADSDIAAQVLNLASTRGARLIVLGTQRRSAVMKLILGSTAQRIILQSECPVLTVK